MHPHHTTKRCSTCGETKPTSEFHKNKRRRDGFSERCKACRRVHYDKPEQLQKKRTYDAQRRAERADQISQQRKERYATDATYRDHKINQSRKQKLNPEYKVREKARYLKRSADPEYQRKQVDRHRERRRTDPAYRFQLNLYRDKRRRRILEHGKPFTHAEWVALCDRYDNRCLRCGAQKPLTVDHIVPVSLGGSGDISNIQPLCMNCNRNKHARTIDYRLDWEGSPSQSTC